MSYSWESIWFIQGLPCRSSKMLLHSYKITRTLPCLADPEKIRVIAEVSGEIHEAFPYLNAILKGCIYNHPAMTLTIKKDQKLITLHAYHITLAKIEDEKEAEEILKWLKDLINETYERRSRSNLTIPKVQISRHSIFLSFSPGRTARNAGNRHALPLLSSWQDRRLGFSNVAPSFRTNIRRSERCCLNSYMPLDTTFQVSPRLSRKDLKAKTIGVQYTCCE